ncbi:hypothetical protein BWR60_30545 [Inquilinus limosus]|uniref:DUF4352 domain-containing protein n=1 Tax=Inquilinus limosus TaxID=171674 RepID=A0A211Z9U9_9PROT|nr:hypothetical protein BWR60_30545 [Inquilinus limosus]
MAALLVVALLLLGMQWTTPLYDQMVAAIPVTGQIGDTVAARKFTVRIETIQFARQLRFEAYGKEETRDTSGLWAVVTATVGAQDETTNITEAYWEGPTGLRYSHTNRLSGAKSQLVGEVLQPGMPRRGWFIFEIREDQARGATFVAPNIDLSLLDSIVRIRLGDGGGTLPILDSMDLDQRPGVTR